MYSIYKLLSVLCSLNTTGIPTHICIHNSFFSFFRNSNVSTVEEELFKALLKADIILQTEFDYPKTMKFQRAARTDKGVSAVRQIVSLKIPLKEICNTLPEKINQHLPPEVRVIGNYSHIWNIELCSIIDIFL